MSPGSLLQDGVIQAEVSHQLLETGVLLLETLQLPRLLNPHATVFLASPVVRLLSDSDFPAGFDNVAPLAEQDLSFPQLVDDLLRRVSFLHHVSLFLSFLV